MTPAPSASSRRACEHPGCSVPLDRRNNTGLCARHYRAQALADKRGGPGSVLFSRALADLEALLDALAEHAPHQLDDLLRRVLPPERLPRGYAAEIAAHERGLS